MSPRMLAGLVVGAVALAACSSSPKSILADVTDVDSGGISAPETGDRSAEAKLDVPEVTPPDTLDLYEVAEVPLAELPAEVEEALSDVCVPSCLGVECGDDGCGGSCGECGADKKCDTGSCVCAFETCASECCADGAICFDGLCCAPSCVDTLCGTDGCGGSCGECDQGYSCRSGETGPACNAVCADLCVGNECGPAGKEGECDCGACDDGNACTDDWCTADGKCQFGANSATCDDGNPCTENDLCGNKQCSGTLLPMEQLEDKACLCTSDADCVAVEDGDVCNGTLKCDLDSPSPVCVVNPATVPECEDGIACTLDSCDPLLGCVQTLDSPQCDDKNVCTGDNCVAGAGCQSLPVADGPECVPGFPWQCVGGACKCVPQCAGKECGPDGCGGSCGSCGAGCECAANICVGFCGACAPDCVGQSCGPDGCGGSCGTCAANQSCDPATYNCKVGAPCTFPASFSGDGLKVNFLKAGISGKPGEAVDVDHNAATCAPTADCSSGLDNQFAALMKSLAIVLKGSQPLVDSVVSGELTLLYEMRNPTNDGKPFTMVIYRGTPVLPKAQCDFQVPEVTPPAQCGAQGQACDYQVLQESYYPASCLPISLFDNAEMAGGKLVAGGPGYHFAFPFVLALAEGKSITFVASHAKIVADVTLDEAGNVKCISGVIGCAVAKSDVLSIADAIPEENLPFPKSVIISLLDSVVKPDIDADGDGIKESVSSGMKFTAIPGNIK